jgi:alpha-galactosidase
MTSQRIAANNSCVPWCACGAIGLMAIGYQLACTRAVFAAPEVNSANTIALTPPMGWNSWDAYGLRINEQQFRANVAVLASSLRPFGYRYAVIDEGWYMLNPKDRPHPERLRFALDRYGRFIPVQKRFPSSVAHGQNTGFQQLARAVHAQDLRFGVHIVRGIPRASVQLNLPIQGSAFSARDAADQTDACPWDPTSWGVKDSAAGQAWYDSLLRQYAIWGVDLLKVDCISDHPYKASEIRMIHLAIKRSGRPMTLSLSPGPTALEHHSELAGLAQMWRVSNDIWDIWDNSHHAFPSGIKSQFENAARWAPYAAPGNWPDADMLPVGDLRPYPDVGPGPRHTRLTPTEQRTLLSLWVMARSPLIVGANLTRLDEDTRRLLTNPEVIRIDQHATASEQVAREGDFVVWRADLSDRQKTLGVFNLGDTPMAIDRPLTDFGLSRGQRVVRNVWTGTRLASGSRIKVTLDPHACLLLMLE